MWPPSPRRAWPGPGGSDSDWLRPHTLFWLLTEQRDAGKGPRVFLEPGTSQGGLATVVLQGVGRKPATSKEALAHILHEKRENVSVPDERHGGLGVAGTTGDKWWHHRPNG